MISENIKLTLGLQDRGMNMGESFMHGCEILYWPVKPQQEVFVMDCDYQGKPLREGILTVFTVWRIGLKVHKEVYCTEDLLLTDEGRTHILKELLL